MLWAVLIARTRFPALIQAREHQAEVSSNWRDLLGRKHFLFALLAQFMYVIAQVGTWSYFIQYAQQYGHVRERTAGLLLTGTQALSESADSLRRTSCAAYCPVG